jgi:tetratricopeptide (TPR) repeat protein
MADDIKAMTAELARDPGSLVFLKLGEALRARGQIEAATRIAASGVVRHPELAPAHDLYARVLVDQGDFERAYHEWTVALELEPRHFGAHKGLGFLCYRWGDLDGAIEHLELALAADPTDATVVQALQRVREGVDLAAVALPLAPAAAPAGVASPWDALEGGGHDVLLADRRGLLLAGSVCDREGRNVGEELAAEIAVAAQEADRTARLLDLGEWRSLLVEGETMNLLVSRPTGQTVLLLARDRAVPQGRLAVLAERAAGIARAWLQAGRT